MKPLQVEKWLDPSTGTSTGRLGRPDSLMRAVETLVEGARVDAVAVVGRFPDDSVDELVDYRQGQVTQAKHCISCTYSELLVIFSEVEPDYSSPVLHAGS